MADKIKIALHDCIEKVKKDGSKYFIYHDIEGVEYISKNEYKEGEGEYFISVQNGEFNGKPTVARWISTEEYKPAGKDGKQFFPKQPDKVAILKEAGAIADTLVVWGISPKPKTKEEFWALIDGILPEVKKRCL